MSKKWRNEKNPASFGIRRHRDLGKGADSFYIHLLKAGCHSSLKKKMPRIAVNNEGLNGTAFVIKEDKHV